MVPPDTNPKEPKFNAGNLKNVYKKLQIFSPMEELNYED